MRITLTIPDQIDERLRKLAHERGLAYEDVASEALEAGIRGMEQPSSRFKVIPRSFGLRPEVNSLKLNQLSDEFDTRAQV